MRFWEPGNRYKNCCILKRWNPYCRDALEYPVLKGGYFYEKDISYQTFFVKIGLIGLLLLFLLIGVAPAKAAQVIAGAIPDSNANYLIGAKYRSFANSPNPETILGLTPLADTNPATGNFTWREDVKNYFKFTYDPESLIKQPNPFKRCSRPPFFNLIPLPNPHPQQFPVPLNTSFLQKRKNLIFFQ